SIFRLESAMLGGVAAAVPRGEDAWGDAGGDDWGGGDGGVAAEVPGGRICQLDCPWALVSSRMSGCCSTSCSICTRLDSSGISASCSSSFCSVAICGREK